MSNSSALTVVVPRLLEQLQLQYAQAQAADDSLLARIAGRGAVAQRWAAQTPEHARLAPWQYGLLTALALPPATYPSAPLCAVGRADTAAEHAVAHPHWIHADPIHLVAGLNDVTLLPLQPAFDLTSSEQDAIHETLAAHLREDDLLVERMNSGSWLIGSPSNFDVETVHPRFAARHEWGVVLPQGAGANRVQRLTTEIQMLLHEHPVNMQRERRGAPTVNALWLWGAGQVQRATTQAPAMCVGRNEYLRGISRANGWPEPIDARSAPEVLEACKGGSTLAVLDAPVPAEFETQWLIPLLDALKTKRIDRLELVLDQWLVTLDRWRWRRVWRPALPLAQWVQA